MSDMPYQPLSVCRLLPRIADDSRGLAFDYTIRRLMRWQTTGSSSDYPTGIQADWLDEAGERKADFPSGYPGAPVLSRRLAELLGEEILLRAGALLPLWIDGVEQDEHRLYVVEQVVDCVDLRRSSKPKRMNGEIKKAVFRPDAVPADLPAFRIPQFPTAVYWNGWAATELAGLLGEELEARLVWSEEPARIPHPDPWGF